MVPWRSSCRPGHFLHTLSGSVHCVAFVSPWVPPALQWTQATQSPHQQWVKPGWSGIQVRFRDKLHQRPFFKIRYMLEGCKRTLSVVCAVWWPECPPNLKIQFWASPKGKVTGILGKSHGWKYMGTVQKARWEILGISFQPTAAKAPLRINVHHKFLSASKAFILAWPILQVTCTTSKAKERDLHGGRVPNHAISPLRFVQ